MTRSAHFTPGNKSNARRMIDSASTNSSNCACIYDKTSKILIGSDSPSIRFSNTMRLSQLINFSKGGKTQYGNFYLGQPLNINYLGRMEGMPGGSGSPPTNF
jgi:hypothetical protein